MRRSNIIVGACLCGLAFVGAALLEATRNIHHHQQHLPLYSISAAYTPKLKLWPLDGLDVATFLICAVCLSLAGGAGIGGGAVLVPCFILVRGANARISASAPSLKHYQQIAAYALDCSLIFRFRHLRTYSNK